MASQELQQARKLFEISRTRIDEQPQKGQGLTLSCLIVFPRWWALSTEAIEPNFRFITELVHVSHFVHDGATAIEPGNHASPVLTAVFTSAAHARSIHFVFSDKEIRARQFLGIKADLRLNDEADTVAVHDVHTPLKGFSTDNDLLIRSKV